LRRSRRRRWRSCGWRNYRVGPHHRCAAHLDTEVSVRAPAKPAERGVNKVYSIINGGETENLFIRPDGAKINSITPQSYFFIALAATVLESGRRRESLRLTFPPSGVFQRPARSPYCKRKLNDLGARLYGRTQPSAGRSDLQSVLQAGYSCAGRYGQKRHCGAHVPSLAPR
jgi:hypothetical protein